MADREPSELVQQFFAGDAGLAQVVDVCVDFMTKSDDSAKLVCSQVHNAYLNTIGTNLQSYILAASLFDALFQKLIVVKQLAAKAFCVHYIHLVKQSWQDEAHQLQKYQVILCLAGLLKCHSPMVDKMKPVFGEFHKELLRISQSTEIILGLNSDEIKIVSNVFDAARDSLFVKTDANTSTPLFKELLVGGKGSLATRKALLRILEVEAATNV